MGQRILRQELTFALFDFESSGFLSFSEYVHIWPRLATFRHRDTFWIDSTDTGCGSFCRFCTGPASDIADTRSGLKLFVWRSPEIILMNYFVETARLAISLKMAERSEAKNMKRSFAEIFIFSSDAKLRFAHLASLF